MTKKDDEDIVNFKIVYSLIYLILAGLTIASICCYWRDAHYPDEEYIINGLKVTIEHREAIMSFGIIRNCKISNKDDCKLPDGAGFVEDTSILVLQIIILIIYVFNIGLILISCTCQTNVRFVPAILCIVIFISTVPFLLNLFCLYIFNSFYNQCYFPKAEFAKLGNASKFYKVENDVIYGPYIYKITYSHGYKTALASMIINALAINFSVIALCVYKYTEKPNGGGGGGAAVPPGTSAYFAPSGGGAGAAPCATSPYFAPK